ncbi:helix-turn-helix transcriptional regulator [Streptomyces sp. NPDC045431]|uniref:helix-turn-helix domain-containing protein n=1 Tax=Streptomyces sp. NPDC045431 TaxID=3155613 RepID=UPI003407DEAC
MREVGKRVATARRARRLSQLDLAAQAHISLSMLRKIEQGTRAPSDDTLDAIAAALDLDPSRLVADRTRTDGRVRATLPALSAAIASYDIPDAPPDRPLIALEAAAEEAQGWRLGAQYVRLAAAAPGLVADAAAALHSAPPRERARAASVLLSVARSADAVAYKFGARDLSARLIELMRWAAPRTSDPLARYHRVRTHRSLLRRPRPRGRAALPARRYRCRTEPAGGANLRSPRSPSHACGGRRGTCR